MDTQLTRGLIPDPSPAQFLRMRRHPAFVLVGYLLLLLLVAVLQVFLGDTSRDDSRPPGIYPTYSVPADRAHDSPD